MGKFIIIGSAGEGIDQLALMRLKEIHGEDIEFITPEDAKAKALVVDDLIMPTFPITCPIVAMPPEVQPTGKQSRRNRRAQERKKRKW